MTSSPKTQPISLSIDGIQCQAEPGSTILSACQAVDKDLPTICYAPNLTPINTCRVCVVELEGSRALVPACSRQVSDNMVITTDSPRVRTSRRMVLELLGSSVDLSRSSPDLQAWLQDYGSDLARHGSAAATVAQPAKIQDSLYVRDYARCVLCYKCVQACGEEAQHSFAITVAERGFASTIATEFDVHLPESACVYCGNCIGVCPTGALIFAPEFELRESGQWDESQQDTTRTVCPYCGVGCNLEILTQAETVVRVTSPADHEVSHGHLCIKGRFGTGAAPAPAAKAAPTPASKDAPAPAAQAAPTSASKDAPTSAAQTH